MVLAQKCTECVNSVVRAQKYKLVKQSWLQLMYYATCLPYGHNFREVSEFQNGDEC